MDSTTEAVVQETSKTAVDRNFTSHEGLSEIQMFSLLPAAIFAESVALNP
jgi:hypothetical protein